MSWLVKFLRSPLAVELALAAIVLIADAVRDDDSNTK